MKPGNQLRGAALCVAMIAGLLGACASAPMASAPMASAPMASAPMALEQGSGKKFNTGRVSLYLTDYDGRPLSKAMVNIESAGDTGKEYFRTAAWSDVRGFVSFAGLPEEIRISVFHAETLGNYSRVFHVPSSGTTELRMMIEPQVD
jgi:hypothetical protein